MISGEIRYQRTQSDHLDEVTDDGQSRRQGRDSMMEKRKVRIGSGRELQAKLGGGALQLSQCGFCKVDFWSSVAQELEWIQNPAVYRTDASPETSRSRIAREQYQAEAARMVQQLTGAQHVFTLHHATRYGKPNPQGVEYLTAYATFAHLDYTSSILDNSERMLMKRGIPVEQARQLDVAYINLWQPVTNVVEQHPLALLDWASVDSADGRSASLGYKVAPAASDAVGAWDQPKPQNQHAPDVGQLVFRERHEWYSYPQMTPQEMLVFIQCDTRHPGKNVYHTAFWDETAPPEPKRRMSIELHLLCTFPKTQAAARI